MEQEVNDNGVVMGGDTTKAEWRSTSAILLVLAVAIVVAALGFPYTHDEELYVTPARLTADNTLYGDFFYHQTPYYPLLLAPVLAAVDPSSIFSAARLFSALISCLLTIVLYRGLRDLSVSRFLSLVIVAIVVLSPTILPSLVIARNDALSALFGVASVCLAVRSLQGKQILVLSFAAGILSACAVLTKVTWSFVPLCVAFVLLARSVCKVPRSWLQLSAYVLGGIAGMLPAVPLALANPAVMFFDIATFNALATPDWYTRVGQASLLAWPSVLYRYVRFLAHPAGSILLVAIVVLWGYRRIHLSAELWRMLRDRGAVLLLAACSLGAVAFALLPRALSIYYFSPIVFMTALLGGAIVAHLQPKLSAKRRVVVTICGFLACIPGLASVLTASAEMLRGAGGTQRIRKDAMVLTQQLCAAKGSALVATLSPIRVLAAGHRIYPELVAGPFVFRSAHLWTPEQLESFRAAGPQTLDSLLAARRPDAIYVGHERPWSADSGIELDEAMARWAIGHAYRAIPFPGSKFQKTFVSMELSGPERCR